MLSGVPLSLEKTLEQMGLGESDIIQLFIEKSIGLKPTNPKFTADDIDMTSLAKLLDKLIPNLKPVESTVILKPDPNFDFEKFSYLINEVIKNEMPLEVAERMASFAEPSKNSNIMSN